MKIGDKMKKIIIVSNDILPNKLLPAGSSGLRAVGLGVGLSEYGYDVHYVAPLHLIKDFEKKYFNGSKIKYPANVTYMNFMNLPSWLSARNPDAVIMSNANHGEAIMPYLEDESSRQTFFVYDLFAPKLLEMTYGGFSESEIDEMYRRKKKLLQKADLIIVNGEKKLTYLAGNVLENEKYKFVHGKPTKVVNFSIPILLKNHVLSSNDISQIKFFKGGYNQFWNEEVEINNKIQKMILAHPNAELHRIEAKHWGGKQSLQDIKNVAVKNGGEYLYGLQDLNSYVNILKKMSISLDVFYRTKEREYAMVTRTVVSLCAGTPVIHPAFTELGKYISEYKAGETYSDPKEIPSIIEKIFDNPELISTYRNNTSKLVEEVFNPKTAILPLVEELRKRDI